MAPATKRTPTQLAQIPVARILESAQNPRKHYDDAKLADLAASLTIGQTTPIIVRPHPTEAGHYELAAGHRRLRAAKLAGLAHLEAIVRDLTDAQLLEVLTIENLQRDDVHPLEEADGYAALMLQDAAHDVPWLAGRVAKSERYIHDRLALRRLIEPLRTLFFEGRIEVSHAIECAKLTSEQQSAAMMRGLFVRERLERGEQETFTWEDREFDDEGRIQPVSEEEAFLESVRKERQKPVSVRELKSWIHRHTRLSAESPTFAIEFPETAETLAEASRREMRVFEITDDRDLADSAKAEGRRTLTNEHWKAAEPESCEHLAIGFHVAGQRQGQSHLICTSKRKCTVHWKEEIAQKARAAARSVASSDDGDGEDGEDDWRARQQKEEAARAEARAKVELALPAIRAALAKAVQKSPAGVNGILGKFLLDARRLDSHGVKEVSKGVSADDLVRQLVWCEMLETVEDEWNWTHNLPALCKRFGVDFKALVKAAQPKAEKVKVPAKKKGVR